MTELERFNINNKNFFEMEYINENDDSIFINVYDCWRGKSGTRERVKLAHFYNIKHDFLFSENRMGVTVSYSFVTRNQKQFLDFLEIIRGLYGDYNVPIQFYV
jgi:hypothetical protein